MQQYFQKGIQGTLLKNVNLKHSGKRSMFQHCASQGLQSLKSVFQIREKRTAKKKKKKSKSFFSLSSPSGKVVQSQEIILAVLRLLRAAPYCPQGKEIGNPTAGIQSVRKSSRPCPQNISSIR